VRVGPTIRMQGAVRIEMPEQQLLIGQPVALSLYDPVAQTNILIAELKNPTARLVQSNLVMFVDCWDEVKADVLLKLGRNAFSQSVVWRERPPDPKLWGLNPKTTRLQVWSEFYEPPEPVKKETVLKEIVPGLAWTDETLAFGKSRMNPGRAFLASDSTNHFLLPFNANLGTNTATTNRAMLSAPVVKKWQQMDNRTFLIEEVEYESLLPLLNKRYEEYAQR
jgi:hypothetical protein